MMKTFLRVFFSCVLSLFLAIAALAGGVCHYANAVISQPALFTDAATNGGYTQQLYEEIVYDWENLLSITGVTEPEAIMAVLNYEQVKQDALGFIRDAYAGTPVITTTELRSALDAKVREYAYSHNIHATPEAELEQNIADLVDACITDYEDAIRVPLLPTILRYTVKIGTYSEKLMLPILIGACVLLLFLFCLQKKRRDIFYYGAISAATGGIVLLVADFAVKHYEILQRLPFSDSAIKTLVVSYLSTLLEQIRSYSSIYLMVAGGLLGLYWIVCLLVKLLRKPKVATQE